MDVCMSCLRIAVCLLVAQWAPSTAVTSTENKAHSRQKRILWITSDGRLALPPGTTLVVSPSLSMPFVRYPPEGFFSNMTISLPFTSKSTLQIVKKYNLIYFYCARVYSYS